MPTLFSQGQAVPNNSGGVAGFPDVCKTPTAGGPVPVPYPNLAVANKLDGLAAVKKISISKLIGSTGDAPGTAKGVISGTVRSQAPVSALSPGALKHLTSGKAKSATAAVLMNAPRQYTAAMTSGQISVPSHIKPMPLP